MGDRYDPDPDLHISDHRTGAVIELPEPVAVALLESRPTIRFVYEKHVGIAGQLTAPPEQRGQLIIFDRELVQRVLVERPARALWNYELRSQMRMRGRCGRIAFPTARLRKGSVASIVTSAS
jgi:hypothetical protein